MSENFIVFILGFGFFAYIVICFINGLFGKAEFTPISDNFRIGYIEKQEPIIIERQVKVPVYKKQKPIVKTVYKEDNKKVRSLEKQIETLSKQIEILRSKDKEPEVKQNNSIYNDCVDALVALGYKKTIAKEEVKEFLSKNDIDSIEQFIVAFFKKDKKWLIW